MHIGRVLFVCVYKWIHILIFLELLLCCAEILLEKYPVQQLTVPSNSVVKQNFLNTNVIANYHILIIITDQDMVMSVWVPTGKLFPNIPHMI